MGQKVLVYLADPTAQVRTSFVEFIHEGAEKRKRRVQFLESLFRLSVKSVNRPLYVYLFLERHHHRHTPAQAGVHIVHSYARCIDDITAFFLEQFAD